MKILNLKTTNRQEEIIKQYLENNATDNLADKINNGVKVKKDGKELTNRKTLDGFFKYATEEAQKLVAKGARSAMVEENTVYGWAMHYFEEDKIIGKLYNEDGTEYKSVKKTTTPTTTIPVTTYVPPVKKPEPQMSLFDFLTPKTEDKKEDVSKPVVEDNNETEKTSTLSYKGQLAMKAQPDPLDVDEEQDDDEPTEDDIVDAMAELEKEQTEEPKPEEKPISPIYMKYLKVQIQYPDYIIAYRLGDFYEVFGDNAKIIANELDLTMTGRDFGAPERVPMVGFPEHVAESYFKRITKINTLVVMDGDKITLHDKTDDKFTVNLETGEVISSQQENDIIQSLQKIFGNQMEIKL